MIYRLNKAGKFLLLPLWVSFIWCIYNCDNINLISQCIVPKIMTSKGTCIRYLIRHIWIASFKSFFKLMIHIATLEDSFSKVQNMFLHVFLCNILISQIDFLRNRERVPFRRNNSKRWKFIPIYTLIISNVNKFFRCFIFLCKEKAESVKPERGDPLKYIKSHYWVSFILCAIPINIKIYQRLLKIPRYYTTLPVNLLPIFSKRHLIDPKCNILAFSLYIVIWILSRFPFQDNRIKWVSIEPLGTISLLKLLY